MCGCCSPGQHARGLGGGHAVGYGDRRAAGLAGCRHCSPSSVVTSCVFAFLVFQRQIASARVAPVTVGATGHVAVLHWRLPAEGAPNYRFDVCPLAHSPSSSLPGAAGRGGVYDSTITTTITSHPASTVPPIIQSAYFTSPAITHPSPSALSTAARIAVQSAPVNAPSWASTSRSASSSSGAAAIRRALASISSRLSTCGCPPL